jgi:hypothetical protein
VIEVDEARSPTPVGPIDQARQRPKQAPKPVAHRLQPLRRAPDDTHIDESA